MAKKSIDVGLYPEQVEISYRITWDWFRRIAILLDKGQSVKLKYFMKEYLSERVRKNELVDVNEIFKKLTEFNADKPILRKLSKIAEDDLLNMNGEDELFRHLVVLDEVDVSRHETKANYAIARLPLDQGLLFLKTGRTQFTHGMTIDHLLDLLYLQMFHDASVNSRILDAADPQISLSAIEASLKDVATSSSNFNQALVVSKNIKKGDNNTKNLTCYRCQAKGHSATTCTAPARVPKSSQDSDSSSEKKHTFLVILVLFSDVLRILGVFVFFSGFR